MTTQPETAVGSDDAPVDAKADALKTFEDMADSFFDGEGEEEPEVSEEQSDELTEDDIADEEEADDLPPIDAPVSWDAEAKEVFKSLPREAQEIVQKREADRERFVQQKSQEAARARQEVEQAAYQQLAQYERQVSQQLEQYAQSIAPQRPDPTLLATNPYEYAAQQQKYDDAIAQRQQAQQREAYAEQAHMAEQRQMIVEKFPEYADPTTGPKLQGELTAVARELGYPPELIGQARATDILAMRTASEWKAKASKYDALMAKKMEGVRAAKGKPPVSVRPGVAVSADHARQSRSAAAFERAKAGRNINEKADGFAEWAKLNGLV